MSIPFVWRAGSLLLVLLFTFFSSHGVYAQANGVYTIQSKLSGKLVQVENASTTDGANIHQMTANGQANQRWTLTNLGGSDYSVINVNSGKAMEVYNFDTADGANVVQYEYWGGDSQIWTLTDRGNGFYSFVNKYTGKGLDLLNWNTADGANIAQWAYWGGDPQLWALNPVQTQPPPPPSNPTALTIQENQSGFCSVDGTIDSNHTGFVGSGFANTTNATNTGISWSVNAPTAGTYTVSWRYANGGSARPGNVLVDGTQVASGVAFGGTGGWTTWAQSASVQLNLSAGVHALRLVATSSGGLANIDSMSISGANPAAASCNGTQPPPPNPPPSTPISFVNPGFTNIGVHDPSVIFASNQYYVFGSHLSAARSANLTNWTRVADGVNNSNPLFNNVTSQLSEALTWAETTTLWAPDVAYVNGRYLMYYNACRGDSPRSAMGIASASSVQGPYTNQGLILRSGMWGQASEDGSVYNANVHPNVVDPAIFTDNSGGLWMMYGSYSGGIFIMELNPSTGFPYSGQGYGKHLMGGNHARIEGPYVIYAPETGYYYMFVSFGGLGADGGYNVRVSRSQYPDGPYYDARGTNMSSVKSNPSLPLFDDASIALHGVKVLGNHVFSGTNNQLGYVSPGHNSAYRKASTGQYFLVFHTRFPGRGEAHEVRVHEFHFNEVGWPVIAPLRYAEKIDANNANRSRAELEAVAANEIAGTYQFINHGKDMAASVKSSSNIQLASGGSVSGAQSGSWSYTQNTHAITLYVGGVSYQGVVSRQWNQVRNRFEVTFSALSSDGTAVWGIKSN